MPLPSDDHDAKRTQQHNRPDETPQSRPRKMPIRPVTGSSRQKVKEELTRTLEHDLTEEPDGPICPASSERLLRDLSCLMVGVKSDDDAALIDHIITRDCDGSRVTALEQLLQKMLPQLLEQVLSDIHALGVVGDPDLALTIYLVGTSRILDDPLHLTVQGPSGSGKSFPIEIIAGLMPPEATLRATSMSALVLYRMPSLNGMFILLGERRHKTDDDAADATAALRQLISEGQITRWVTEPGVDCKLTSVQKSQEGRIATVQTTTLPKDRIFPEDLNRTFLRRTDSSEEQTRRIMQEKARQYAEGTKVALQQAAAKIKDKHHAFQRSLKKLDVVIPYAGHIEKALPAGKPEIRRLFQQVLSMLEVITVLHQHQRQRDSSGKLIATLNDYTWARRLLAQPLGESIGASETEREAYASLVSRFGASGTFTTAQAQALFSDAAERTVRKWLAALEASGCIKLSKAGAGRGGSATWQLIRSPDDAILPTVDELREAMEKDREGK